LPSPLGIVEVTTYYTVSKTVVSPFIGADYVEMWSSDGGVPNTNNLYTPVECGSGTWEDVKAGLSGRVFGTLDNADYFVLDSEDANFWFAHRVWMYDAPDPTASPTFNPNPSPTATPTPGGLNASTASMVNYLTIAGLALALCGYVFKGRLKK
jgi:hypothetical protein